MRVNCLHPRICNTRNKKFAVFDIEWTPELKPVALGIYSENNYKWFKGRTCIAKFLDYIQTQSCTTYYAHNGGRSDFNFILEEAQKRGYIIESIRTNNRILKVAIFSNNRVFKFIDSVALLPATLSSLCKAFKVKHQKLEIDYENIEDDPRLEQYLMSDCIGLYEVMQTFMGIFKDWKVPLRDTLSQQAMLTFRSMLKYPIPSHKKIEGFIRNSYYGGRTEVFKRTNEETVYYFDFNSLYPYVMYKYPMPVGKYKKVKYPDSENIGFAEAVVNIPNRLIPLLPYRTNKLVFPIGKIRGFYDTAELKKAEEIGYKVSYKRVYEFEKDFIFRDYVDKFYKIKKETNDKTMYMISKLLLNSLYGKFGQRRETKKIIFNPSKIDGLIPYKEEFGMYEKDTFSFANHILPAIASHVTSMARLELFNQFENAGFGNVFYCDTDSIVTNKKLPTSDKLGDLKREYTIKKGYFIAPKFYYMDTDQGIVVKIKGFQRKIEDGKEVQQFFESDFKKALRNDFSSFKTSQVKFGLLFENLKRNNTFVSKIERKRSVVSKYDKRVLVDNVNTAPISF